MTRVAEGFSLPTGDMGFSLPTGDMGLVCCGDSGSDNVSAAMTSSSSFRAVMAEVL
jgi:hypothetical protein